MGNCVGSSNLEDNVFKVRNINDSRDLVQKGLMEVTQTELIYIDSDTRDDWHWPLKFLRKYGCDGDVFTFEAGRKCPGGEGLYAFSTRKASALFELVAKNIQQGELQPPGELSPFSESQALDSSAVLSFPPNQPSNTPAVLPGVTNTEQPSYTNLDIMGKPLQNGDHASSDDPSAVPKSVYREVVFEKPPEDHPKPQGPTKKVTSYSQIDFERTAHLNSADGRIGAVPGPQQGGRAGSTSSHAHHRHNGASRSGGGGARSRHNTYTPGNTRDRNKSEGSFTSSQGSLSESCRDVRSPRTNGGVTGDPNSSMYQNVQVGGGGASGLQEPQQQYQNVSVGAGSVNQVFENGGSPQQQPNYCNITVSSTAANSSTAADDSLPHDMSTSTNSVRLNGMGNYAQLELSSEVPRKPRSLSSSAVAGSSSNHSHHHHPSQQPQQSSYLQLDFNNSEGRTSPTSGSHAHHSSGRRSASLSAVSPSSVPMSSESRVPVSGGIIHQNIPEEEVVTVVATPSSSAKPDPSSVKDPTKVEYEMLNFPAMKALVELSSQREQEIEREKEQREREQKEKEKEKEKGKKRK